MPYGIKANVRAPHRYMRMGALVWIINPNYGNGAEKVMVTGMSRGGRKVETWIDARDLSNYRPGWVDDAAKPYSLETRDQAQNFADIMMARFGSGEVRPHAASFGRSAPI